MGKYYLICLKNQWIMCFPKKLQKQKISPFGLLQAKKSVQIVLS